MEKIRKVGSTLRNNWKKTVFIGLVGGYGVKWYSKKLKDEEFMRCLAREALSYGSATIQGVQAPTFNVTVILNPVASGGKGRKLYEKYCSPLLHLAGMKVSVIRTESEGQAKDIMEIMADAEAVLVAGGDGTLMEAVTGLLRRKDRDSAVKVPIGILPVGKTNTMARRLFNIEDDVRLMGEATMSVVRQLRKPESVIEVENRSEDENMKGKKIYCVNRVEHGAWKDARLRADRYWLFGFGLKHYVTYIGSYLTGHKEVLWDCDLDLKYTCESTPIENQEKQPDKSENTKSGWASWWRGTSSDATKQPVISSVSKVWKDYGLFNGTQITIAKGKEKLLSYLYKGQVSFLEFSSTGFCLKDNKPVSIETSRIESDQILISPNINEGEERKLNVDGDDIDFDGPVLVTFLKDQILVFCDKSEAINESQPITHPSPKRWSSLGSNFVKHKTF